MATYYSAFFSSGLLASHYTPDTYSPSTPRVCSTPLDDQDTDMTPTTQPVASSSATTLPSITTTMASPTTSSGSERPRLRRRRSSVTTSTSPVSALKSSSIPARTATASLQRLSLYTSSPTGIRTRSRSGSITDSFVGRTSMSSNEATQGNSLVGRMRSGSVGNSLRPRRTATRRVASTTPAPPPPTAPLPALPIPIICPPSSSMCSPSTPRRPLARRSQPSENLVIPINTPPAPRSLSPFIADDYPMPSSPLTGAAGIPSGLALHTSVAAFDYPSPIDTPGERFVGSYFPPFDMEMKEN